MIPVIYLLDQIPFKNYNVYVSDSSNLFDKASVKENQKKDWSDEHGYDIDLQSRYHNSKTITIDCFIPANSLKECIKKYNDFFNALDQKGSRRLSVIAGDLRMEYQVFRQDTAENKLIYDDSNAVGTFKLKLIENMPVKRILKSYNQPFIKMFQDFYDEYLKQQIDGRNLFLNSKARMPSGWGNGQVVKTSDGINFQNCTSFVAYGGIISQSLQIGEEYTISIMYRSENTPVTNFSWYLNDDNQYKTIISPDTVGEWKVISDTRRIKTNGNVNLHLYVPNGTVTVAWIVITKGNKVVQDWTPALEDVQSETINYLNQISSDNILSPTEKAQLKNKVDEIKNQFNELISKQSISNNLQIRYNEMIAFSDFILTDLNSNSTVNSKFASITLKSKKVLIINWGDGTEEYTSPNKEVYSHRYTNSEIYFPMILGDLDSITLFNSNADILWNRF